MPLGRHRCGGNLPSHSGPLTSSWLTASAVRCSRFLYNSRFKSSLHGAALADKKRNKLQILILLQISFV